MAVIAASAGPSPFITSMMCACERYASGQRWFCWSALRAMTGANLDFETRCNSLSVEACAWSLFPLHEGSETVCRQPPMLVSFSCAAQGMVRLLAGCFAATGGGVGV